MKKDSSNLKQNQALKTVRMKCETLYTGCLVLLRRGAERNSAERTANGCRPIEPDPDNTGGGKKQE